MKLEVPKRADFIHHQNSRFLTIIREVVFGAEDGMVSTLGSITGIAVATNNHSTIIIAGLVIVSVESISMGVGAFLSTKSEREIDERILHEERIELSEYPNEEQHELKEMYVRDGWPEKIASQMVSVAAQDKKLLLKEMSYRELGINQKNMRHPFKAGTSMFISYVIGGTIPVIPYLLLPVSSAVVVSIAITFIGLFSLGVFTTKFTHRTWWKSGFEMLALASIAAIVGYGIGQLANTFI